ncbi:ribbon-helix-helix protein, CopG family [Candidatus Soleaferrea massiliensis]|uniref:ribbon-helix-helix protein, CopG family n=1 Tax=Candidatus Soleaferrea massiliensis TaxID=1470354 RepID=UPI00058EAFD6|nr:ribbon-helix-helix protein, CopG family [Candidatus Soleaferrea massiliensis]
MEDKLIIPKKDKKLKGDDGHKIFSIRVKEETAAALEEIANMSGRTRNEIINLFLLYGIEHYEIEEECDNKQNT